MRALAIALVLAVAGCGGDNSTPTPPPDMAHGPDMASFCGHPGDQGNSLGVGKYCTKIQDCSSNSQATLCSALFIDNANFCTMTCTDSDMGLPCGEGAHCQCGSSGGQSGCACYPDSCS